MKTAIGELAEFCNDELAIAGCQARWELDTDRSSNSVGTWFCGSLGGVTDIETMRKHTHELLAMKYAHPDCAV